MSIYVRLIKKINKLKTTVINHQRVGQISGWQTTWACKQGPYLLSLLFTCMVSDHHYVPWWQVTSATMVRRPTGRRSSLAACSSANNLTLNAEKTKELWKSSRSRHFLIYINGTDLEFISRFKFPNVHIFEDLSWHCN